MYPGDYYGYGPHCPHEFGPHCPPHGFGPHGPHRFGPHHPHRRPHDGDVVCCSIY